MADLFDHLAPEQQPSLPPIDHAAKRKPAARKKRPAVDAPDSAKAPAGAFVFPSLDSLDPVIYGVRRAVSGEQLCHVREGFDNDHDFEVWKLRNLPLVAHYTAWHFSPEGQVKLLRQRQYSDQDIARMYPHLAPLLDG